MDTAQRTGVPEHDPLDGEHVRARRRTASDRRSIRRRLPGLTALAVLFVALGAFGLQGTDRNRALQHAIELYRDGEYEAALGHCQSELAKTEVDSLAPWFGLYAAFACLELGRPAEGQRQVEAQLARTEDPYHVTWAGIVQTRLHLAAGRTELARDASRRALDATARLDLEQPSHAAALHESRQCELRVWIAIGDRHAALQRIEGHLEDPFYEGKENALADLHYDRGLVLEQFAFDERASPIQTPGTLDEHLSGAEEAFTIACQLYRNDLGEAPRPSAELGLARAALARVQLRRGRVEDAEALCAEARAAFGDRIGVREAEILQTVEARIALRRDRPAAACAPLLAGMEDTLERAIASWSATELAAAGLGFLHFRTTRTFLAEYSRMAVHVHGETEGVRRAVAPLLRLECLGSLARSTTTRETLEVDELVEDWLGDGAGLLVYLLAAERSLVFMIDSEGVGFDTLEGRHDLEALVRDHVRLLTSERRTGDTSVLVGAEHGRAQSLGDALCPPRVAARVKTWRRASVMGLSLLGYVPFELAQPAGFERRLGLALAIDRPASLPLCLERHGKRRRPRPYDLLVVGGVRPSSGTLERWPHATALQLPESQSDRLAKPHDDAHTETWTGDRATVKHLSDTDLGQYRVLQFLAHGVVDLARSDPAGLVLGDRCLFSEGVRSLPAAPEAVLLTSCQSGLGRERIGDPHATDLAGAWLKAGARSVLVTQADVVYGDMLDLSAQLHHELRSDSVGLAEALRRARVELARGDAQWPFRFGPILIIGLGHEPLFAAAGGR